ncbi:glycoside hydrolase family 130 protein [Edaphobacter dinghuensis]|nr:glycoside hydrolase family 130 protein [Edaphobacter dinghuensis]
MPPQIKLSAARQIAKAAALLVVLGSTLAFGQQSWTIGPFHRPVTTPVIMPNAQSVFFDPLRQQPVHWEASNTFNPAAIVRNGKIYVLYRAEDDSGPKVIGMHTSRLGLATSGDGVHFTRSGAPVFYPADDAQKDREWPGGVEDPRVVEAPDGSYVLTYTQWNRKSTSIGVATSKDLVHWTKYGPVFPPSDRAAFHSYKSSGIVTQLVNGRLIAARINNKFWMYWGEVEIHLATSPDLIHWTALEDANGDPIVLLKRRDGLFDSGFPEVGPPAVVTKNGIVLLYNGKNGAAHGAAGIDPGAYSVGEALFSADDPAKLLKRTDAPVFRPELPFERSGQYPTGTTFAEGLVYFKGRWMLYYGCADSFVGVAVAENPAP